jgi:hypothetical protein
MTQERFFQILEAYGADPARWPDDERAAAEAFAQSHRDQVAAELREAAALDACLVGAAAEPSDLLERRILKAFPAGPARPEAPRWQIPAAAAAALVLGAFIGFASGALTASDPVEDTLLADAVYGFDQDWVDWLGDDV